VNLQTLELVNYTEVQKKYLTKDQAHQKAKQYCAYQERSHYEVEQKLWELGIRKADQGEIISALIEEDYLNEERFAIQFAGGKFRMNEWGKKKIMYALKEKRVSEFSIKKALKSIDEDMYLKTLLELVEKKYESLKEEQHLVRKRKLMDYMLQKGFESELVSGVLKEITGK
jgi:regulatory protein